MPEGQHRIKVKLDDYENFEKDVPSAINGIFTVNPILIKKNYITLTDKPSSKGSVRIHNNKLKVDFDGDDNYNHFFIKEG